MASSTPQNRAGRLADLLLEARKNGACIESIPEGTDPENAAGAYAVQDIVAAQSGPVRGWKIGAPSPDAEPFCAPLHQSTLFSGDTTLPAGLCRFYGVESEIVYRIGKDLPLRSTPWTETEIRDAIASVHPAIEIFDTRFCKPGSQKSLTHLADQGNHGALIYGPAMENWQKLVPVTEHVRLFTNNTVRFDHNGGNSAGDPIRLLVWLAGHAASRGLALKAGDIITTGSMTGTEFADPGTVARVEFASLGSLTVTLP